LVTTAICFFWLRAQDPDFKSETTFYINQANILDQLDPTLDATQKTILLNMSIDRIYILANSDDLRDSIIKDFDLYHHYRIADGEKLRREIVMKVLNKNINLYKDKIVTTQLNLIVHDMDRNIAAAMANRIVARINAIDYEVLKQELQEKLTRYEATLKNLKQQEDVKRTELVEFYDKISPTLIRLESSNANRVSEKIQGDRLLNQVDEYSTKYKEIMERYYFAQSRLNSNDINTLTTIKKATHDTTSYFDTIVRYCILISIFTVLASTILLFLFIQNKEEIWLFLFGK
jgi:hypothetical protein